MSQPQLPVAPDDPRNHNSWLAYIAALYPGKVTLTGATDEERREWTRKVRGYAPNPRRHAHSVRPRERRDRSGRSSQRSGDSGSDDGGSEPPPPGEGWRWTQPAAWQLPTAVQAYRYGARRNRRVRARELVVA
ncbi:MAG: hypothetical protein ACXVHB_28835 [Solirubrobacteraceae bacterium]